MRTIIWFIYFWFSLVALIPRMHQAQKHEAQGDRLGQDELVQSVVGDWMRALLGLAGVRITVTGKENIPVGEPVVFVANHQGYFDIPLLLTQLDCPHPLVAKTELQRLPLIRGWMRLLRCVFLERENPR
ncbi:MAG: lysophospholipid acyltransferase family protein, partial [Oscillospiraceae bacterium]